MQNTPHQAQKTIITKYEQCGISLGMFQIALILAQKSSFKYRYLEGSKWPVLQNLSLIYIIMKIHEKKITTLSIGILWTATTWQK